MPNVIPWGWLIVTTFLYAAAGLIMASFPAPYWIWNLALAGVIIQALALAGPQALRRFGWWRTTFLTLAAILGTGAMVVALAIALNHAGTDKLDDIVPKTAAIDVLKMSLMALVTAAAAAIVGAETGDRLLGAFTRLQTSLVLAAVCILGLGAGGLVGILAVSNVA
ncbi:MAG: hypothetical protein ACFB0C_08740 [Leptolyngbyaceae cyanobacterium]